MNKVYCTNCKKIQKVKFTVKFKTKFTCPNCKKIYLNIDMSDCFKIAPLKLSS